MGLKIYTSHIMMKINSWHLKSNKKYFSSTKTQHQSMLTLQPPVPIKSFSFLNFLLPHLVLPFKDVKDKICHELVIFERSWPSFCEIWINFTHLKIWIAAARHNFKWVKISIESFGGQSVNP